MSGSPEMAEQIWRRRKAARQRRAHPRGEHARRRGASDGAILFFFLSPATPFWRASPTGVVRCCGVRAEGSEEAEQKGRETRRGHAPGRGPHRLRWYAARATAPRTTQARECNRDRGDNRERETKAQRKMPLAADAGLEPRSRARALRSTSGAQCGALASESGDCGVRVSKKFGVGCFVPLRTPPGRPS